MELINLLPFTKNNDGAYEYTAIPTINVKIVKTDVRAPKRTYTVYVDKRIYVDEVYMWSIRYARHNIDTLTEAKEIATWLYTKVLSDNII